MTTEQTTQIDAVLGRVLEVAHEHLGLDVAWFSEFTGGEQRVRAVAGDGGSFGEVEAGTTLDHSATYCSRVVAGALPNAIPDVRADPRTREMPVTQELGVGAYVGVPVVLPGGQVFGMLCSLSHSATPIAERDVQFLAQLVQVVAGELGKSSTVAIERAEREARIREVIRSDSLRMVFQPIVDLATMEPCGAEALARFDEEPRNPAEWFAEASMLGMEVEIELAAISRALGRLDGLPVDAYLSVNASPSTIMAPAFRELLRTTTAERIVVEITEQIAVGDYAPVVEAIRGLRELGVRVAVDDAGAGYASLNHILRLRPDIIKLDLALVRDIDADPARQALAKAMVQFSRSIGASVVAEGVETRDELDMLVWLGIRAAQGYFLARPGELPLPHAMPGPTPHRRAAPAVAAPEPELETFVRSRLAEVVELTGLESSYLTFHRAGRLEHRWVFNGGELEVPEPFTIDYDDSLCGRCRAAGLVWTAAVSEDLPGSPLATAAGIETFVSVPVGAPDADALSGTLCALGRKPRFMDGETLDRVQGIAAEVAARLGA